MSTYLILFTGGLFLTAGDIVFKQWANNTPWHMYIFGLALYLVGLIFLVRTYRFENIAVASALLVIFNILTLVFVSWLYFKEPITLTETLGILLSFGAIFLLHP